LEEALASSFLQLSGAACLGKGERFSVDGDSHGNGVTK
jgi:hypothetical protein